MIQLIAGSKFHDGNTVMSWFFLPPNSMLPATQYRATLNSDILQYTSYSHFNNANDIHFHTPLLKLENTISSWNQDENTKNYWPQLDLMFNYPVDPSGLKEKLKMTLDDKPVEYTLQTLSASSTISVRLANIPTADKDYEVKLQLDKGLVPVGGSNGTPEQIEASAMIPSPFI